MNGASLAQRLARALTDLEIERRSARLGSYSSDLGLLGEQSSPKREIPCPGHRWTAVQNVTPHSFILGGEIRNRTNTQNYKKKQTKKR